MHVTESQNALRVDKIFARLLAKYQNPL